MLQGRMQGRILRETRVDQHTHLACGFRVAQLQKSMMALHA